jgi:hypothetical protein
MFVKSDLRQATVAFSLARPLPPPEVVAKNPVSVIGKREDHPNGWSSLLLCCAALIDANLKKSIK